MRNKPPLESEIDAVLTPLQRKDIDIGFRVLGIREEHDPPKIMCCWTGLGEMPFFLSDESLKGSLKRRWPEATQEQLEMGEWRVARIAAKKVREFERENGSFSSFERPPRRSGFKAVDY